jgi:hypothetical protein
LEGSKGFEDVDGSEHVGLVGLNWVRVGFANKWLGGKMQNEVGLDIEQGVSNGVAVTEIAEAVMDSMRKVEAFKEGGLSIWGEGESVDFGSKLEEPFS